MKKFIFAMLLLAISAANVQAQSLYKTVYDRATAVVNNPSSSDEEVQINQFKVTALNYISMMVKKRGMNKDSYFYDSQAVNCYINDKSTLTPFCIDTNWEKAYDQATTMVKLALR